MGFLHHCYNSYPLRTWFRLYVLWTKNHRLSNNRFVPLNKMPRPRLRTCCCYRMVSGYRHPLGNNIQQSKFHNLMYYHTLLYAPLYKFHQHKYPSCRCYHQLYQCIYQH